MCVGLVSTLKQVSYQCVIRALQFAHNNIPVFTCTNIIEAIGNNRTLRSFCTQNVYGSVTKGRNARVINEKLYCSYNADQQGRNQRKSENIDANLRIYHDIHYIIESSLNYRFNTIK